MEYHFLIGDVAKKYNISNQTLIYYSNFGLLKPNYTHDNGYRYYNHMDLERLEIIIAMRDTGMSLKKIKSLLDQESRSSLIETLNNQLTYVDKEITKLRRTKDFIKRKVKHASYKHTRPLDESIIKVTKQTAQYIRVKSLIGDADYITPRNNLKGILDEHKCSKDSIPSRYEVLINKDDYINKKYYKTSFYQYEVEHSSYSIPVTTVPTTSYLSIIHFGQYDNLHITYERINRYMYKNKLIVDGHIINIPIVDSWFEPHESKFITEVLIPFRSE